MPRKSINKQPTLRKLLEQALATDGDFNAFCMDYFPDTYKRFASGMDRVEKVNLLFTLENVTIIDEQLKRSYPKQYEQLCINPVTTLGFEESRERNCIVHPLQRARHFFGRASHMEMLQAWWNNEAASAKCQALCGLGGSGKTAIIEQFVRWSQRSKSAVAIFVWSFYDDDNAAKMIERFDEWVSRVRDKYRILLVLDGLERVQSSGSCSLSRGTLTSKPLRLLLRQIVSDSAPYRLLITSRFSVVDLKSYAEEYHETNIERLPLEEAVALLRTLGVKGDDATLRDISDQCGRHALTLTVFGTYIAEYKDGKTDGHVLVDLNDVVTEIPEAYILKRCLVEHALCLSDEERRLMSAIALDPHALRGRYPSLSVKRFQSLGLLTVAEYGEILIIHPALRDFFVSIHGKTRAQISAANALLDIDLTEQPGPERGECSICTQPAQIESVYCDVCEIDIDHPGEPSFIDRAGGRILAYFEDHRGNSDPLECPECGNQELHYEFFGLCSYHEHVLSKDD